jgi:hypothetical protein
MAHFRVLFLEDEFEFVKVGPMPREEEHGLRSSFLAMLAAKLGPPVDPGERSKASVVPDRLHSGNAVTKGR